MKNYNEIVNKVFDIIWDWWDMWETIKAFILNQEITEEKLDSLKSILTEAKIEYNWEEELLKNFEEAISYLDKILN